IDRAMAAAAGRLLALSVSLAQPSRRPWVEAVRGELEEVDGGPRRLLWALGGLSLACTPRRFSLPATWRSTWVSWPVLLRTCSFGVALAVVLIIGIVWSNVIVPSHESDDEYSSWYFVFYAGLAVYFLVAGFVGSRGSVVAGMVAGAVTAIIVAATVMVTFIVVDNLFLDVVIQQPDKAAGFRRSGLHDARAYVNQGNWAALLILPFFAGVGAGFGAIGGLIAQARSTRRLSTG
ncbi:MAG: hypothetical protein J2P45_28605, partial [Candidatus Dormibacteraeota bacterium]|nr:hypothetical protein [Candidatus Dormibacteraeota bacterium]